MARNLDRSVRFSGPGGYVLNMLVFLTAVGALAFWLSPLSPTPSDLMIDAYNANRMLNGTILAILGLGIIYNLRQALVVGPAVDWLNSFRDSVDPTRTKLPRAPALIGAMARMLLDADEKGGRLTQASSRAILDSIGTRMDEGREFGRYMANLLVFLGLLGTFWGLLQTITAVGDTINGLASTGSSQDAVAQLITNLQKPLSGMGTAFSSSLFGLAGSLVVGFLDIQAGQAQNRFYSDLEDWLSGISETTSSTASSRSNYAAGESDDVLSALNNIELALAQLNKNSSEAQEKSADAVRAEIRQLGRTLIEGVPAESGNTRKKKG